LITMMMTLHLAKIRILGETCAAMFTFLLAYF
jgi:hypothetical protein